MLPQADDVDQAEGPSEAGGRHFRAAAVRRLRWLGETRSRLERDRARIVIQGRDAGLGWDEMSRESGVPRETLRRWAREQPER